MVIIISYNKQKWNEYNDSQTADKNLANGAIISANRLNHMETGISNNDTNKVTDNKDDTEQLNGVQVQPYNKLSDAIGGRNLLINTAQLNDSTVCLDNKSNISETYLGLNIYQTKYPWNGVRIHWPYLAPKIKINTNYVLSEYVRNTSPTKSAIVFFVSDKNVVFNSNINYPQVTLPPSSGWVRISALVNIASFPDKLTIDNKLRFENSTTLTDGYVQFAGLDFRQGTVPTSDWTPAPEDKADDSKVNNEFKDRGVNVKWFGAKGDGVTDDTLSIQSAIDTGRSIFLPPGKYNVTELTGFAAGQIIQGISKAESWGAQDSQNITLLNGIGSSDNYVIKNRIGGSEGGDGTITAITVRNLSIEGSKKTNGILVGASSSIVNVRVHNCKTGFASVKASTIENCFITGCENGFYDITDSRFTNNFIYLNDVGLNLTYSNDNIISNNKIEWNGIGISIDRAGCDLISNNIFDRSTTYGIYTTNAYQLTITGNLFKRNLTNHLYLGGSKFNISANSFYRGNSKDNQTGPLAPDVAIFAKSIKSSMITNNFVNGKMFNKTGSDYASGSNISANTIDGIDPDNIMVNIPETTVVHGQDTKIIIPLPSYFDGALNNPYNVEILSQRISSTTEGGNFYYNGGIIKSIYVSTSGIELTISNGSNNDLKITGNIYIRCPYPNLY